MELLDTPQEYRDSLGLVGFILETPEDSWRLVGTHWDSFLLLVTPGVSMGLLGTLYDYWRILRTPVGLNGLLESSWRLLEIPGRLHKTPEDSPWDSWRRLRTLVDSSGLLRTSGDPGEYWEDPQVS